MVADEIAAAWRAAWEHDALGLRIHISGMTNLFPDDFSTAWLRRVDDKDSGRLLYALEFARDKQHFCDENLVGPVDHYERSVPRRARWIRILLPEGKGAIEISIPDRPPRKVAGWWEALRRCFS